MHHDPHAARFTPARHSPGRERRSAALAELIATAALLLCTVAAATAVSAGIARAATFTHVAVNDGVAIATLLGLFFAGLAGMTAGMMEYRRKRE